MKAKAFHLYRDMHAGQPCTRYGPTLRKEVAVVVTYCTAGCLTTDMCKPTIGPTLNSVCNLHNPCCDSHLNYYPTTAPSHSLSPGPKLQGSTLCWQPLHPANITYQGCESLTICEIVGYAAALHIPQSQNRPVHRPTQPVHFNQTWQQPCLTHQQAAVHH